MEIPYTVTSRKDTGLYNAKIGIWLFLASEVMLFGGLFASYIFLRITADYPWPRHVLNVPLGFVNTLVLIGSSVTVVLAWAALKMRQWRMFQVYMGITILCAFGFLGIKTVEYTSKFSHYGVFLKDDTMLDGHLDWKHHHGDDYVFEVSKVTVKSKTYDADWIKTILKRGENKLDLPEVLTQESVAKTLEEARENAKKQNQAIKEQKASGSPVLLGNLEVNVSHDFEAPVQVRVPSKYVRSHQNSEITLKDGSVLSGKLIDSKIYFEAARVEVQKPNDNAGSILQKYLSEDKHAAYRNALEEANAKFEKRMERHHTDYQPTSDEVAKVDLHAFLPHHEAIGIERADVSRYSATLPSYNNYYAIYFTLTGLHGLHVVGGMLVLGHFLFFGKKIYLNNPEHLANRVEVGGLFWHFVDLVWIFLFPLLYLL